MSAGELLSIAQVMGNKLPASWMLTVRGYSFRFAQTLSDETADLVDQAYARLLTYLCLTV